MTDRATETVTVRERERVCVRRTATSHTVVVVCAAFVFGIYEYVVLDMLAELLNVPDLTLTHTY